MKTLLIIVAAHLVIGIIIWTGSRPREAVAIPSSVSVPTPIPEAVSDPLPPQPVAEVKEPEQPSITPPRDPMARWGSYATGYTWRSASEEEKRALVQRLAAVSRHGNSASYFYDALEEFYSEPSVRKQKLSDICTMVDAGGSILPKEMRDY